LSPARRRLNVFVTVGMGPWPFDRLLHALGPVIEQHEVFVQTGTSHVPIAAPHARFLNWAETQRRLREADVVITHAGNTVRLVQRLGKVPIAVAREAARGEMRNDHQVEYLAAERHLGRLVALEGALAGLAAAVDGHPVRERAMLASAPPLPALDGAALAALLGQVADDAAGLGWVAAQLAAFPGPHRAPRAGGPPPSGGSLASALLVWPSDRGRIAAAHGWLRPGGLLLVQAKTRRRDEVLAALTGAGFLPRWCDGGSVSAIRP
jgi:UDP-N-acetylglucosamine transferase subunit ALG13